jgi:hypothetical protein
MRLRNLGYAALIAVATAAFVIGSAATGQAKAAKKMAAPPPPPVICMMVSKPVCGVKGGMTNTYANSCFAAKDGAKVIYQGACKAKKAKKAKKAMKKPAKKKPAMKKKSKKMKK